MYRTDNITINSAQVQNNANVTISFCQGAKLLAPPMLLPYRYGDGASAPLNGITFPFTNQRGTIKIVLSNGSGGSKGPIAYGLNVTITIP